MALAWPTNKALTSTSALVLEPVLDLEMYFMAVVCLWLRYFASGACP